MKEVSKPTPKAMLSSTRMRKLFYAVLAWSLLIVVLTGRLGSTTSTPSRIVTKDSNSTNPEFNKKKDFTSKKQIITTSGLPTIDKPISRSSIIVPFKPKLILHVGPMKTGTTSIQVNLLSDSQKIGRHLTKFDNYQILGVPNYRTFGDLIKTCLVKHSTGTHTDLRADRNGADYKCEKNKAWRRIQDVYGEAYDKAMERYYSINNGTIEDDTTTTDEDFITTINSCETFSKLPRSNFTLELLKDLYEKWDVHIIIFYRPVVDWLPSMYAQHRKHQQLKHYKYIQDYQQVDENEDTIVQYWNKQKQSLAEKDTFSTYQFYDTFLRENLGLSTSSSFGDGKPRIQVLHVYSKLGPEKEMLWNLPHTNHTRQYLENQETNKGFRFKKRNEAMLDSSIDLIITEAWRQNLISIKRREAVVHLDASMKRANITVHDLPQACLSEQDRKDLWKRHLESHSFIKSALDGQEVASLRREFDEKKNKLCCVNATAALRVESLRRLFDEDCAFHSQFLVDSKMEPTAQEDLKWIKMNCTV